MCNQVFRSETLKKECKRGDLCPDRTPSQYQCWASLNPSLSGLARISPDLDNTCNLIPKKQLLALNSWFFPTFF